MIRWLWSLISVAEFAPIFVFSFIGGTFADRWRPKRTMICCDMLSAVSVFSVLLTIHFGSWQSIYFVTFVSAVLSQFSQPSAIRLFKQHVPEEQLQQSMALFQTLIATFMVLGPMLGTFTYSTFGLETSIAVMGVIFLLSALVLNRLPQDKQEPQTGTVKGEFRKQFLEGFRYVWQSQVLRMLGAAFMVAGLAGGIAQTLGLFVVTEQLGRNEEFLQYLLMVNGAAMLFGGGTVAIFAKRLAPQLLLAVGMLVSAVCTVIIGNSTSVPITLFAQFLSGHVFPCIHTGISAMILKWSNSSIVGRVNGVLNPMFVGMMVVSMSLAGTLKDTFSLVSIYTGAGLLYFIGALVMIPIMNHKTPEAMQTASPAATASHMDM